MTKRSRFRKFKTSLEIIRLAEVIYVRFPLSLRHVEDILYERGSDVSHETIRFGGTDLVRCLRQTVADIGCGGFAHTRVGLTASCGDFATL